jgi:hypothetical protein
MGYHPRIETKKIATFQTTRTRCSELWFVNNEELEHAILGYLAKYRERYGVKLYAFSIEGNHIQFPALFPKANRGHFMRDLNSSIARAIPRYQKDHGGGRAWGRRYSVEYFPAGADTEEWFFYTVLQPVQDGLVNDIRDYPGYNCFEDAITGRKREYKVVHWKEYNDARRWKKAVRVEDFTETVELEYERLPGYGKLSQAEYARQMREKLKERTAAVISQRESGPKCVGRAALLKVKPGTLPRSTKTSTATDHRPRVLSKNKERREKGEAWYFRIYFKHKEASARYRKGELDVKFPKGTFKPPLYTVAYPYCIGERLV